MEKLLTYFDFAENDYYFFKQTYEMGMIGNPLCYAAQSICERYLKHIIAIYCKDIDTTIILKTHSLKLLCKFFRKELPDFSCDWDIVLKANGYYYETRYPGEESFAADKEDVEICWRAVTETRCRVMEYIRTHEQPNMSPLTVF